MIIIKKTIPAGLIIAFASVLLSASALAEETSIRGSLPSSDFDTDNDGLISEKEFNTVFSEFDTNSDGQLDRNEIAAGRRAMMDKRREMFMKRAKEMRTSGMRRGMPTFSEFDLDGNGKIPEQEFTEARDKRVSERAKQGYPMRNIGNAPLFGDIDANSDGAISEQEFDNHLLQHRQKMRERREMRMVPGRSMGRNRGPAGGMRRNMPTFADCDLNGDGKILEEEFKEARANRMSKMAERGYPMKNMANAPSFSDIDSNSDGAIDAEEFSRHQSQHCRFMREQREMGMGQDRNLGRNMGPARGMRRNMPTFSEFDLDGNGKIAEKEFDEARAKRMSEKAKQGYPMRNMATCAVIQ